MNRLSDRLLGKYEILDQLGTTGLASVYRARDISNDTVVALKVLHSYFSQDTDTLHRYLQEMERVQKLRHPNIVPVYGIERDDEVIALMMDYVSWPTLKARKSSVLPLGEVVIILRQVAEALDYAHTQDIIHRDLRPSNVFYDQESGQVMVSDFGTATLVEGGHVLLRSTVNTPAPNYGAPEYIQGQPPDPRNDIYAMGALAYELLTGEGPFDALSPYTILSRQLTITPTAPSYLDETLPPAVDDVVLKALSRLPEYRYTSCAEMAEALAQTAASPSFRESVAAMPLERQQARVGADVRDVAEAQELGDGRVICPHCGSGNSAMALRCSSCWGKVVAQQVITREEEERWVARYLGRLRLRKRVVWGTASGVLAVLMALWVYNLFEVRPPLPAPSSTISSQPAAGEWSMAQRDLFRTGAVPGPAFAPTGTVEQIFESEGPILSTPAVAGGQVYVATSDRRIVALDEATGEVAWTYPVSGPVNSSPTVAEDLVFVGLRGGTLLALNTTTGDLEWSYETGNPIYGSATVLDGTLYIGSADHFLYALDARTGELRWSRETDDWIFASPTINKGIVVVGSQGHELYMVDASNGTLRYQVDLGSSVDNAVTIVDDVAYFVTFSGNVLAFDYTERDVFFRKALLWWQTHLYIWGVLSTPPQPGGLIWSRRLGEQSFADLATANGRLFVATAAGKLRALDTETGRDLWMVRDLAPMSSSPIVSGDTVIQAASDGTIYGFDVATGEERWRVSVDEGIVASPILANGTLYVPTEEGTLYALR